MGFHYKLDVWIYMYLIWTNSPLLYAFNSVHHFKANNDINVIINEYTTLQAYLHNSNDITSV